MPQDLPGFVSRRAQRSLYLLQGLRQALADLGHPELVAIIDLVHQDASQARAASLRCLELESKRASLRTLIDLQVLARLGGPKASRLAARLVKRMAV